MSTREKILDDIARLAGGAAGMFSDAGKQFNETFRTHLDNWAQSLDLVPRADFERLEAMLSQSRETQDALEKRIEILEQQNIKKT